MNILPDLFCQNGKGYRIYMYRVTYRKIRQLNKFSPTEAAGKISKISPWQKRPAIIMVWYFLYAAYGNSSSKQSERTAHYW